MSTLDLSETKPTQDGRVPESTSSIGIGARIMRQLRRNSTSKQQKTEKPKIEFKKMNMNSKAIEKLYLNKKLGRFKQTQLETIFEHENEIDANENQTADNVFGKRKIKRSVTCTDGFTATKSLKQKRQRRIQKIFGVHKKLKPISMKKFFEHLQANDTVNVTIPAQIAGA